MRKKNSIEDSTCPIGREGEKEGGKRGGGGERERIHEEDVHMNHVQSFHAQPSLKLDAGLQSNYFHTHTK